MAAEDDEPSGGSGGLRGWRALAAMAMLKGVLAVANRRDRRLDPDDAGIVAVSDEAFAVAERALELGEAGRDDAAAVAELVRLAAGNKRVLGNAERFSRQDALHREDRMFNLAQRLLVAAVYGREVQTLSDDDARLLDTVEAFYGLSREEQWGSLVAREPRLTALETQARNGEFALPRSPVSTHEDPVLRQIDREHALKRSELGDRLRALVGPIAETTDPLLGSRAALGSALSHLARQHPGAAE